ncbi:FAD binding domain-containing protein [Paraburkholderia youngii]|uniref:FAD binding domain-containing protein n=1 Tax=Paraburkholderia youngii TaxID=2782701 RepID=UPI003D1A2355
MRSFAYHRASGVASAIQLGSTDETRFLAGGTNLVDLMKCNVERPATLVDVTALPGLDQVDVGPARIRIGSLARMSTVADHPDLKATAPAVSESLWRAASAQIRNMATMGGNLLQRTRCPYFRDESGNVSCNKRNPGSGCAALSGVNRNHAVLGGSEFCIATYPGDFATALVAFDGLIHVRGRDSRVVKANDFFRSPGSTPHIENDLTVGEFITAIELPVTQSLRASHYLKVRDRSSYEFAAASAAAGLELEKDGRTIKDARIALGGVGTKPWRVRVVEAELIGKPCTEDVIRRAANHGAEGAHPLPQNAFKVTLIPRVIARALIEAVRLA